MIEFIKQILINQFEASLAMMKQRIEVCPEEYWAGKVGADTFRQTSYHALFYLDLYLTRHENDFIISELNLCGGDDREKGICPGLDKEDTLKYIKYCYSKIHDSVNVETVETLKGESGFSWRKTTRGELHIYNIRHFQHHVGQLSTYLRRISEKKNLTLELQWVGSGWE